MIQLNNETRQQKRFRERQVAKTGAQKPQVVLNIVLWKIIMQNSGSLKFSTTELEGIPANLAFHVNVAGGNMTITAGTQGPFKKSNLILPNNGIIT